MKKTRTRENKGVCRFNLKNSLKRWRAVLSCFDGSSKSKTIGYYMTFKEAVEAYRKAFFKQHGYEWTGIYVCPDSGENI